MKTLDEACAMVGRYRDETIQNHGFDVGGDRETEINIFLEWLYDRGYGVASALVGEDDKEE